jgi:hypothetical protein
MTTQLSFYSSVKYVILLQTQFLITFSLEVNQNFKPSGYILLTFGGMKNPTFLGNSSSFKITFM